MNILIAIDKFKGCATSRQLGDVVKQAVVEREPSASVKIFPIADGGDGTVQAFKQLLHDGVREQTVIVHAPLSSLPDVEARYLYDPQTLTAYMDLATASGLALVPAGLRDAMRASTLGTGMMIAHALQQGARHIVLGLGGSATTDAGMGVLSALGVRFLDCDNRILKPCGESLARVNVIDTGGLSSQAREAEFTLLTDVVSPLTGRTGAARMFSPQKGATPRQVEQLEKGMVNIAGLYGHEVSSTPGAGAAGGVAAAMIAVLGAKVKPGAQELLKMAGFDDALAQAHLVITGEGRLDAQTLQGKVPAAVLRAAMMHDVPVVAVCGSCDDSVDFLGAGFAQVIPVTPAGMPLEQAMLTTVALSNVRKAVARIVF